MPSHLETQIHTGYEVRGQSRCPLGLHWALRRSQAFIHALLNAALLQLPGALRPPHAAATANLPTLVQLSSSGILEGGTW